MLRKYGDVIYVLQCGFVGKFGEWHNSFHFLQDDLGFRRELISAVLESLPAGCKTMMRYPFLKQQLFGTAPISEKDAFSALPEARIGHFNDGFLAGPSHGGMQLIPAEIPGRKAAEQPSADDGNIKVSHQNTSIISPGRSSV